MDKLINAAVREGVLRSRRAVHGHREDDEENHNEAELRFHQEPAPAVELRYMRAVRRHAQRLAAVCDKPRHQQEHRDEAAHDALRQHKAEVIAEAELHQHQRDKPRDGRKAGGGYLDDGFGQRLDERVILGREALGLVLIAVGEDDGVVYRERQLHYDGDGIRDRRYLAEPEVCAHVEKRRHGKHYEEDDHLKIAARGKQQHPDDDQHRQRQHADHFARDLREQILPYL